MHSIEVYGKRRRKQAAENLCINIDTWVSIFHLLYQIGMMHPIPQGKLIEAHPKEGGGFVKRDYELGFILSPEVSEEQTNALLQRIEQIVTNHGGQIVKVNQWGRRRLAYPIKHHRDGLYVFVDMILTPETPLELDRTLNVTEEVLRHLIKQRDAKTVQKEREEREARAAAASQAQAPVAQTPAPTTQAEPAAEIVTEVEPEPELPIGDEVEAPIELSGEDLTDVPPAIEETV